MPAKPAFFVELQALPLVIPFLRYIKVSLILRLPFDTLQLPFGCATLDFARVVVERP